MAHRQALRAHRQVVGDGMPRTFPCAACEEARRACCCRLGTSQSAIFSSKRRPVIRTVGHHGYVGDGFRFASNGIVSAGFPPAGAKTGVCLVGDDADEVVVERAHGASAFPSFRLLVVPPSNGHEIEEQTFSCPLGFESNGHGISIINFSCPFSSCVPQPILPDFPAWTLSLDAKALYRPGPQQFSF